MDHLVRFATAEGRDASHVSPSLEEALRFVERLRNNEEASVVRVYRLTEVPITFKTYFRAELRPVDAAEPSADVPAESDAAGPDVTPGATPSAAAGAGDVESVEQQARKLFSRG